MDDYTSDSNYDYNYTYGYDFNFSCPASHLYGSNIFLPIAYYLIFFTGFLGNVFVILVVSSKSKKSGRLVDTFIVNLAVADLIFVLTLPLWAVSASRDNNWEFGAAGNVLCKLSSYIISVNRFSNIFFLTCMSVDRYLVVVKLMDSRHLRRSRCIRATCAAVWLISLVFGLPSLVYRQLDIDNGTDGRHTCKDDDESSFFLGLNVTMVFLTFVFPIFIIVLCYGTIIMHLNKHCVATGNSRAEARRRHSLKMVLCIIMAFVVSWLPFNFFKVIQIAMKLTIIDGECETWVDNGLLISCCLAFFSSCVNPGIYFFLDHNFRRRVSILCKTCQGKSVKLQQSHSFSASFTNAGTSESYATNGGRTQFQMTE